MNKILEKLKEINNNNLKAIIKSGRKLIIVFSKLSIDVILRNSKVKKDLSKEGFIPVFVTEEIVLKSLDVYPLEYLDMKTSYEVLFGKDIFSEVEIKKEDVRLETEQKFKGVEIRLNQIIFEVGRNWKKILKVCFLALEDAFLGLKGLLFLKGKEISQDEFKILEEVEKIVDIDLNSFRVVIKLKNKEKVDIKIEEVVSDFYNKVSELARFADQFRVNQ